MTIYCNVLVSYLEINECTRLVQAKWEFTGYFQEDSAPRFGHKSFLIKVILGVTRWAVYPFQNTSFFSDDIISRSTPPLSLPLNCQ